MNLAALADRNLSEFGEYERLIFDGRSLTNRELHERSCNLAGGLRDLGLGPGDRVASVMPNSPEVLVIYPAVWRAGMTIVPILPLLESQELQCILENSTARAVITSPEVYPKVSAAVRRLAVRPLVIVTGAAGAPADAISFEDVLVRGASAGAGANVVHRDGGDIATILYTSGTTGRPKGVLQTHDNLHANAMNHWNSAIHHVGERTLLVLPLAHTFGLSVLISGYLLATRSVLMRSFDPGGALALIERHRVEYMVGVPTMFAYLLMHPSAGRYDTSSMKRWLVGAAPMPVEQIRAFERKFGGRVHVGYGLSEACPTLANDREGMPRKPGAAGVPLDGVRIRIVDDGGRELPPGGIGEICAQGANISPGYYENPEATAEAFRDGWLFTGDIGYLDEDGYLFLVDRKKDLIIRSGLNVYPKDVEEVIRRHPAVVDAAVVGVPDAKMGEDVCAYVVAREESTVSAEEIIAHCRAHLATYKTPRHVGFVPVLPKTALGKIRKTELRRMAECAFRE